MGFHPNLKNFGAGGPLASQSSIYSLTFDELQNSFGGLGKHFGSMNMDELLRNILTAEETQAATPAASVPAGGGGGVVPGGNLQKQGSLTLPRTLSSKTIDGVWKYLMKETDGAKDAEANLPRREPNLGAMTLEEFLLRAGVTREDMQQQQIGMSNNGGFFGNNSALALGFQQANTNNWFSSNDNSVFNQTLRLPLNMNGFRSSSQQQKQPVGFAPSMHLVNTKQVTSPVARSSVVGIGSTGLHGGGTYSLKLVGNIVTLVLFDFSVA